MSRLFLRKKLWLCLSLLALATATSSVRAQGSVNVTATASPLSPDWVPAPSDPPITATSALSATVTNPPTAPYPCTLSSPEWEWAVEPTNVQYSADNITWSGAPYDSYYAWIVQSGSTAMLNVNYSIGGYWKFPCSVGVSYNDSPCGDTWFGTTAPVANGTSAELKDLTVIAGATQTNVTQTGENANWAAVKLPGAVAIAQATTLPDNADAWSQIFWTGGSEGASANQRIVDKSTSAMTTVTALIEGSALISINIWIIWADVTIQTGGNRADDNNAQSFTDNGGNWPLNYGGGKALGAIDHDAVPGLTYCFTIGKIQATGKLTPAGVGGVIATNAWKIKRTREDVSWDNGGHYTNPNNGGTWAAGPSHVDPAGTDDTSDPPYSDLDPTSGGSVDTIYDRDAPGCSFVLGGLKIYHTSEVYINFTQYVTVTLDTEQICSDNAYWSYQAQVDGAKPLGSRVDMNKLGTALIDIAARINKGPNYAKR